MIGKSMRAVGANMLLLLVCGCSTATHDESKMAAEKRWSEMRGSIRLQLATQQFDGALFEAAEETAREALALDATLAHAYAIVIKCNLEIGRVTTAATTAKAAAEAGVQSPELIYLEGVILEQQNRIEEALNRFEEARQLQPENIDFHVAVVETLVALDRKQEALSLLGEHSKFLDDQMTSQVLTAQVAALMGDHDRVDQSLTRVMGHQNVPDLVKEQYGILLAERGDHGQAIGMLKPLVAKAEDGASGAARRALARAYLATHAPESAEQVLQRYVSAQPQDDRAFLILAEAALALRDTLTALHAVSRLEQLWPDNMRTRLLRAMVEWRRGNNDSAIDSLAPLLSGSDPDVDALCLMAEILLEQDDKSGAQHHFQKAIALDPESRWARQGLSSF